MAQSQERRKRRAVRAVSKKTARRVAKGNGVDISEEVSLDPQVQGTKIAALEHALERIVKMHELNHVELHKAFQMTDAHLWVLRQICKDIVAGTVMMSESETPAVNMEAYYDLFNAWQRKQAEDAAKKKALEDAGVKTKKPEDAPEVFGGDGLTTAEQSAGEEDGTSS